MFSRNGGLKGPSEPSGFSARAPTDLIPDSRPALSYNFALDLWLAVELVGLAVVVLLIAALDVEGDIFKSPYVTVGCSWVVIFWLLSWQHRSIQSKIIRTDRFKQAFVDWTKASVLILVGAFLTGRISTISRLWSLEAFVGGVVLITVVGVIARRIIVRLSRSGRLGERIAIYGYTDKTEALIRMIESGPPPVAKISGIFDERNRAENEKIRDRLAGNSLDELIAHIKQKKVDTVIIDLPWSAVSRIDELVKCLEQVSVNVLMAPVSLDIAGSRPAIGYVGGNQTISLYKRRIIGLQAIGKKVLDRTAAAFALLILAIPFLIIGLIIKIDSPGAVLFRQKRRGMNNESFDMLKFRSMHSRNADANADKLVSRNDSRVTRVGAILRRTSVDELPQLVNVLLGHMSLVGPRPHAYGAKAADRLYEEVVRRYPARHRVLPGITGLAQVRGYRGNTEAESDIVNRVESDIEYIDRWTLALDIQILARTAATFLFQTGAY